MKFAIALATISTLGIYGLSLPVHAQSSRAPQALRVAAPVRSTSASVWDGVYTAGQAKRGAALTSRCVACHGLDFEGDEAPTLVGPSFTARWNGWTLGDVFQRVVSEVQVLAITVDGQNKDLPAADRALLNGQASADLLAYILHENRLPTGTTELPVNPQFLSQIRFQASTH